MERDQQYSGNCFSDERVGSICRTDSSGCDGGRRKRGVTLVDMNEIIESTIFGEEHRKPVE